MNINESAIRCLLEEAGLNPTLNRLLVLATIRDSDHPLAAAEVHKRLLREHTVNRVTVYRILDLLAEKGVVNRISSGERAAMYCLRQGRWRGGHSHFHCLRCGEVQCIDNADLRFNEDRVGGSLSLEISNVDLRLDGVCAGCQVKPVKG